MVHHLKALHGPPEVSIAPRHTSPEPRQTPQTGLQPAEGTQGSGRSGVSGSRASSLGLSGLDFEKEIADANALMEDRAIHGHGRSMSNEVGARSRIR